MLYRNLLIMSALAGCAVESGSSDTRAPKLEAELADFVSTGKKDTGGVVELTPEAIGVLHVANSANANELTDAPPAGAFIHERAAANMIAFRLGDDGILGANPVTGTTDDATFETLAILDAVPFVGPDTFQRLLAYAIAQGHVPPPPPPPPACVSDATNVSRDTATSLALGAEASATLCQDLWYRIEGHSQVIVSFEHALGDIDAELQAEDGRLLDASAGTNNSEALVNSAGGVAFLRVYGFLGATNSIAVRVEELPPPPPPPPACTTDAAHTTRETALEVAVGETLAHTGCEALWYRVEGPAVLTLSFVHADNDIDMELTREDGTSLGSSIGVTDTEELQLTDGSAYLHVYHFGFGPGTAAMNFTLTVTAPE